MKKIFTLFSLSSLFAFNSNAQCPNGQANVTVDVLTDTWGYECFWDITPTGNGCGNGAIGTYGNIAEVSCTSGGSQVATAGGYGDNITTTETVGCLTIGSCFDINYVDDYGDGGATFTVSIDGVSLAPMVGADAGNVFTFCINNFDVSVSGTSTEYAMIPISQGANVVKPLTLKSEGIQQITGATATVNVMNGANVVFTNTSAPAVIAAGATANATFSPYIPTSSGNYTVSYNATITEADGNMTNNTFSYSFIVSDSVYARDNGVKLDQVGIGAGEVGYLGNKFTIVNPINLTSISAMIGNTDGTLTDSTFTLEVFNMDGTNTPTTSIVAVSGTISATADMMYTLKVTPVLALAPGDYLVAVKETPGYQQQIAYSDAIITPETVFASWETQPWAYTETFGFAVSFIIRPNLNFNLGVDAIESSDLTVYPNPTESEINITNLTNGTKVEIYNNLGQLVYNTKSTDKYLKVNVSDFQSGVYVIKSFSDTKTGIAKFIKK